METKIFNTVQEQQQEASRLLKHFSQFTAYKHDEGNVYKTWLERLETLSHEKALRFLCQWFEISRRQPQILLLCASSFPDHDEREDIHENYSEEDGMVYMGEDGLLHKGGKPHYDFLEDLIIEIGGKFIKDTTAESMNFELLDMLRDMKMTPAQAIGALAAIEHPALDISFFLHRIVELLGLADLIDTSFYLKVHVLVEPIHICLAHGKALQYMQKGEKEKREVIEAFEKVMGFWQTYWSYSFSTLGFTGSVEKEAVVDFGSRSKWA